MLGIHEQRQEAPENTDARSESHDNRFGQFGACSILGDCRYKCTAEQWERASSRDGGDTEQGLLNWFELTVALVLADAALSSFFLGFLYLARIVYWI